MKQPKGQKNSKLRLINTISQSAPEIGRFFHLSEIDPLLVREYDKRVFERCIENYQSAIIGVLNIDLIDKALNTNSSSIDAVKAARFKSKVNNLRDWFLGLYGIEIVEDSQQTKEDWKKLHNLHCINKNAFEKKFKLPNWITAISDMPNGQPQQLYNLWAIDRGSQNITDERLDQCSKEIDEMRFVLNRLVEINNLLL